MKRTAYDRYPCTEIESSAEDVFVGYDAIAEELLTRCREREKTVITVELYPGTDKAEVLEGLLALQPVLVIDAEDCALSPAELDAV